MCEREREAKKIRKTRVLSERGMQGGKERRREGEIATMIL